MTESESVAARPRFAEVLHGTGPTDAVHSPLGRAAVRPGAGTSHTMCPMPPKTPAAPAGAVLADVRETAS
ncbi:hypothetical protein ACWCP6_08115 [Streptomyces sp. NPDC002004]